MLLGLSAPKEQGTPVKKRSILSALGSKDSVASTTKVKRVSSKKKDSEADTAVSKLGMSTEIVNISQAKSRGQKR